MGYFTLYLLREGSIIAVVEVNGEADADSPEQFQAGVQDALSEELEDGFLGDIPVDPSYSPIFTEGKAVYNT